MIDKIIINWDHISEKEEDFLGDFNHILFQRGIEDKDIISIQQKSVNTYVVFVRIDEKEFIKEIYDKNHLAYDEMMNNK